MGRSGSFQAPPGFRDSATRALNPGEVVTSTYAVRAEVARTDTGIVYEARDMMLDRPVALKLAWRDPGMPSLILEARRCAAVRDPCAVAIYGMGNHQGIEYVAGERVAGRLLAEVLQQPLPAPELLAKHRRLVGAVTRAHEAGIAVGELSGATVLVDDDGRMVLGRLSLSQVPAFGPRGRILAPEVVRGEVQASDPSAAEAIDLYGLGCVAIEMARGLPPFVDADPAIELRGHALEAPPRLGQVRPDLPGELSDLVEWLLEKRPVTRPRSARRGRWLWSLARRGYAAAQVELASEGTDAAHKLNRDLPDLVFVSAGLRGVMNAYELCMYARGIEAEHPPQLVLIGGTAERDRALFAEAAVPCLADDFGLGSAVLERVRGVAREPPRRRRTRSTISG
ncbi:MAG: hypothetical protein E6J91_11665 [Deltaproteobacteria bacterium]|nr:MAG: hypothetical protein E6J91_11665 [Deltaproteobacteria bacterium]